MKFHRNKLLISEKNKLRTSVGYARAIDGEVDYLNKQINHLKKEVRKLNKIVKYLLDK